MKKFCMRFFALTALVSAAFAVDDFTDAKVGEFPKGWGSTEKRAPSGVIDSGDAAHGSVMCVPGRKSKDIGYTRRFLDKPVKGGVLKIEFDFLARGDKEVFELAAMPSGCKLGDLFKVTPFLIRWDGRSSTLHCQYDGKWKMLGKYTPNEWHRFAVDAAFAGPQRGTIGFSFDGKPFGPRRPMRMDAESVAVIWFVSRPSPDGGSGAMLIDNVNISHSEVDAAAEETAKRIVPISFHSKVLDRDKRYMAVLPAGVAADSREKLPMLLLLHGRGRNERSLVDDPAALEALLGFKGVVVLPSGDDNWYINSPVAAADRYQDYLAEVISDAESKLPVTTDRAGRGICGWSMGGYGSAMFAEAHPEMFAAFAPVIGLLDFPRDGLPKGQSYQAPEKTFGTDREVWKRFNPINGAEKLRGMKILVITGHSAFDRTMNENFAAKLKELGIPCEYRELRGGHAFSLVTAAVKQVVEFMNQNIAGEAAK